MFSLLHPSISSNRKIAVDNIKRIRILKVKNRRTKIRKFEGPKLNFESKSVFDLIDLTNANISN